jgi:hypothetical protein
VVCLDSIFISDAHALAVLPNIARFTLDEELPSAFVIVTYGSRAMSERFIQEDRNQICGSKSD